jgi:hypothetical protein
MDQARTVCLRQVKSMTKQTKNSNMTLTDDQGRSIKCRPLLQQAR